MKILVFCILIISFFLNDISAAGKINTTNNRPPSEIIQLIKNGGLLVTDKTGNIIYAYNEHSNFIPASIIKIITTYFALQTLGFDFKFFTDIYFDEKTNDIFVKGYGDPMFVSENMQKLADEIISRYNKINNIFVDDSFFDEPIKIPGISDTLNPYDTQNGALTVNFNTAAVKFENGEYQSAEPQTPITDFIKKYLRSINFQGNDRVNIGKNIDYPELYFGELLKEMLFKKGLRIAGEVSKKETAEKKLSFRFSSDETLESLVQKIHRYSNNFMINQIFLYIGALQQQPPAALKKSVRSFNDFIALDNILKKIIIEEASGLSRDNKISCAVSNYVLTLFEPYKHLLTERSGGLFKTGTLTGAYSVSGYYNSEKFGEVYITIIINQSQNTRNQILNKLIELLD